MSRSSRVLTLNLRVSGDDPQKLAELLIVGISNFRPMWDDVAKAWRADMRDRFRTQGASAGTRWPTYRQTDEEQYYQWRKAGILGMTSAQVNRRLLRWAPGRERLFPSLISPAHPEHIDKRTRTSWTGGTLVPYAFRHDKGIGVAPEEQGGHQIPRRPLTNGSRKFNTVLLRTVTGFARGVLEDAEKGAKAGVRSALTQRSAIRGGLLTTAQAQALGAR